jgi:hypothetical protein
VRANTYIASTSRIELVTLQDNTFSSDKAGIGVINESCGTHMMSDGVRVLPLN